MALDFAGKVGKPGSGEAQVVWPKGAAVDAWQGVRTKGQFKRARPGFAAAMTAQSTNGISPRRCKSCSRGPTMSDVLSNKVFPSDLPSSASYEYVCRFKQPLQVWALHVRLTPGLACWHQITSISKHFIGIISSFYQLPLQAGMPSAL